MPDLNVLCGIADAGTQSEQPVTKHLLVEVTPVRNPVSNYEAWDAERSATWRRIPARAEPGRRYRDGIRHRALTWQGRLWH